MLALLVFILSGPSSGPYCVAARQQQLLPGGISLHSPGSAYGLLYPLPRAPGGEFEFGNQHWSALHVKRHSVNPTCAV
jgi:hypothetical protein